MVKALRGMADVKEEATLSVPLSGNGVFRGLNGGETAVRHDSGSPNTIWRWWN